MMLISTTIKSIQNIVIKALYCFHNDIRKTIDLPYLTL